MKKLLILIWFALWSGVGFGQITSITILPPVTGYSTTTGSGTIQLSAVCRNGGSIVSCPALTWGSDTPAVATVNSSGLVTGAGVSTFSQADIFAYNGTVLGHHPVLIDYNPTTVTITTGFSGSHNVVVGTTVILSAFDDTYSPFGASDACAWTSGNTGIATVNNIGEVTAVGAGTTSITCTANGHTPSYSVTVVAPSTPLNTYYFRTDGSNATNCTGLVNAAYTTGTGQPCAWNDVTLISNLAAGDTASIQQATFAATNYVNIPSGTPAHHTQIIGACNPSCSTDPNHAGNRSKIVFGQYGFGIQGKQNIDIIGLDVSSGQDCNSRLNSWDFQCSGDAAPRMIYADQFTANINRINSRFHQAQSGWSGAPGPGVVDTNVSVQGMYLFGNSFDDPFGQAGVRADGYSSTNTETDFSGFTEEIPKTVTSVSRAAGSMTIVFAAGQHVNYLTGTNVYLEGFTPSDLNGTYPTSSITFNQQTVSITSGTVVAQTDSGGQILYATFTTALAPAFGVGDFVCLTGMTPSFLNDCIEVGFANADGFTANVSKLSHPAWSVTGSMTGGTASTANTVTVTAAGSSETASVLGTASHVYPFHRGFDQGSGGASNGDAWGAGFYTIGVWSALGNTCLYNLQDCWDSVHGAVTSNTVNDLYASGNEGIPAKVGIADAVTVTNSQLGSNAGVTQAFNPNFPPDYNQYIGLPYRANNGFLTVTRPWSVMNVSNNTWMDMQNVAFDSFYAGTISPLPMAVSVLQNNLFICASDVNGKSSPGVLPAIFNQEAGDLTAWTWMHNQGFNCRDTTGDQGSGNNYALGSSPATVTVPNVTTFLGEQNAIAFNLNLLNGSVPPVGTGLYNAYTPTLDFNGATRPNPPSIGAFEPSAPPSGGTSASGGVVLGGSVVVQ